MTIADKTSATLLIYTKFFSYSDNIGVLVVDVFETLDGNLIAHSDGIEVITRFDDIRIFGCRQRGNNEFFADTEDVAFLIIHSFQCVDTDLETLGKIMKRVAGTHYIAVFCKPELVFVEQCRRRGDDQFLFDAEIIGLKMVEGFDDFVRNAVFGPDG